jgi:hypothetical protein
MEKGKKKGFTTRTVDLNDPKYDRKLRDDDPEWIKKMARRAEKLGLRYYVEREDEPITVGMVLTNPGLSFDALFKFITFKHPDLVKKEIERAKAEGLYLSVVCRKDMSVEIHASMQDPGLSIKDIIERQEKNAERGLLGVFLLCPNHSKCKGFFIYAGGIDEDNKCPHCGCQLDAREVESAKKSERENERLRKKAGVGNPFLARV